MTRLHAGPVQLHALLQKAKLKTAQRALVARSMNRRAQQLPGRAATPWTGQWWTRAKHTCPSPQHVHRKVTPMQTMGSSTVTGALLWQGQGQGGELCVCSRVQGASLYFLLKFSVSLRLTAIPAGRQTHIQIGGQEILFPRALSHITWHVPNKLKVEPRGGQVWWTRQPFRWQEQPFI